MTYSDPTGWLLLFMGIGLFLFFFGFKKYREEQLIKDTPRSKVRSIAMGMVELQGQVIPASGNVLTSPFSARECVYYKATIEEYVRSGKTRRWETRLKDEKSCPFFLQDETGKVLVDPNEHKTAALQTPAAYTNQPPAAEFDLPESFSFKSSTFNRPPDAVLEYLAGLASKTDSKFNQEGVPSWAKLMLATFGSPASILSSINSGGEFRFAEHRLATNDPVFVLGTAASKAGASESSLDNQDSIVIQKGTKESFFLISDKSVKDVEKDLALTTWALVLGGAAIFLFTLFQLLVQWHLV